MFGYFAAGCQAARMVPASRPDVDCDIKYCAGLSGSCRNTGDEPKSTLRQTRFGDSRVRLLPKSVRLTL